MLFFICTLGTGYAQVELVVHVKDDKTSEELVGAVVREPISKKAVLTDENGRAKLLLPTSNPVEIQIMYSGYKIKYVTVSDFATEVVVQMTSNEIELQEVVINENTYMSKLNSTQMSMETVDIQTAKLLPMVLGEVDVLKVFQLKPGIQSGNEGSTGLYVRGGGPEQNLFLMDEATVYNPYHLFGFFSVFNADAVSKVDLYKGGFPAEYGGRLSSVVDVKMREGDKDQYRVTGGIGTIATRLGVEGPIQKGKSSFLVSGRRTYIEPLTRYINSQNKNTEDYQQIPDYNFQDVNIKLNYILSPKDKVSFTGYYGRDKFSYPGAKFVLKFSWGNTVGVVNWQHKFNEKLYVNTAVSYSSYDYRMSNKFSGFSFNLSSGVQDYTVKNDWTYFFNRKHTLKAGLQTTSYQFAIGRLNAGSDDRSTSIATGELVSGFGYAAYIGDEYDLNARLKVDMGVRLSGFVNTKNYTGFEPRFSARYKISGKTSVKINYTRMLQYIHLATNSGSTLPTDIWYPSTARTKPEKGNQVAGAINISLFGGKYFLSDEVYYKWNKNQIDFRDGAQLFVNPNLEQDFVYGKGWSYGNEIYLEKKSGRFTGWIGYTLAWTWRQFDAINNGAVFHPRYDRRHDFTFVGMYKISPKFTVSVTSVYGSGTLVSLPTGRLYIQDVNGVNAALVPVYNERNNYRIPAYTRTDIGIIWKTGKRTDLAFSIYNVFNRRNTYLIYFAQTNDPEDPNNTLKSSIVAKQISLFPIIPSLTFNFKF